MARYSAPATTCSSIASASPEYQLTWKDRRGADIGTLGEPAEYANFDLSPDATRVVVGRNNQLNRADRDLWLRGRRAQCDHAADVRRHDRRHAGLVGRRDEVFYPVGTGNADIKRTPCDGGA